MSEWRRRGAAALLVLLAVVAWTRSPMLAQETTTAGVGPDVELVFIPVPPPTLTITEADPSGEWLAADGYWTHPSGEVFIVHAVLEPVSGRRPHAADITTTGATLPGQPGVGVPDGVVDLDDLGRFLNLWSPREERQ